ncbi:MAG: hypothetical protein ACI4OL_06075 [Gemmiger sp.]
MLMKILFYSSNLNEADYRRQREFLLKLAVVLALVGVLTILFSAFGVPLLVADPDRVSFCCGMYAGLGTAVLVIGVVVFLTNYRLLQDPQKLRAAFIKDTDERTREISNRTMYAAGLAMLAVLYAALLVAVLFWPQVFWFCYVLVLVFAGLILLFKLYYEKKL